MWSINIHLTLLWATIVFVVVVVVVFLIVVLFLVHVCFMLFLLFVLMLLIFVIVNCDPNFLSHYLRLLKEGGSGGGGLQSHFHVKPNHN